MKIIKGDNLDHIDWVVVNPTVQPANEEPHVTHSGVLEMPGASIKVYQLSNGMRVVDANEFETFMMGKA